MTDPARNDGGLKAELTLLDSTMINVGTIIASAIFIVPAFIAAPFKAPGPAVLAWVVGGLISLCGALSVAELGAAMPKAGGQFVYLSRAFGPVWGYLYGWAAAVIINPASIAAIAVGFATYAGQFVALGDWGVKLVAIASILVLTGLNCLGLKAGAITQNVLTFIKIAGVVGLIAVCFLLRGGSTANFAGFWDAGSPSLLIGAFGVALINVLWAYDGWIEITYVGSEMRRPERDMPLAILFSTLLVTVLYVAVSVAMVYVLGNAAMGRSERVAADAASIVLGGLGATLITVVTLVSTLGANNGIVFTAARVPYAMAREGRFFRWAGLVSPRYDVPTPSLVVQGIWSASLVLLGGYEQLAGYVVFVSFMFYALACAAVIVLRVREPNLVRPYRAWGYPVTPIVFILFSGFLVINAIVERPVDSLIGVGLLVLGLVVYRLAGWHRPPAAEAPS